MANPCEPSSATGRQLTGGDYVYVEDVDAVVERALRAGAKILLPVKNQFWGDRTGRIIDPSGHVWTISTRVEETSAGERNQR